MESETATTLVAHWLGADRAQADRLRQFYDTQGLAGLRSAAEDTITSTAGVSGIAEMLLQWGRTNGPQMSTRDNVLVWACQQVDWQYIGDWLVRGVT